jgi:hypothetical protein
MKPKEKAKKLVESMVFSCRECDYEAKAKQCALILVSAIILENLRYDYTPFEGSRSAYFIEVEKEILAL